MHPCPIRLFCLINLLACLALSGCVSVKPKGLSETPMLSENLCATFEQIPVLFREEFEKALFKATLDIGKHHLTGLLFIKRMPDTAWISTVQDFLIPYHPPVKTITRILFSNEFGMTYFDLEFKPDSFGVVYCFEPMNKQALWKVFGTAFALLMSPKPSCKECSWFIQHQTNALTCHYSIGNFQRWCNYSPEADILYSCNGRTTFLDKTFIQYLSNGQELPTRINIGNPVIKMKFRLVLLSGS